MLTNKDMTIEELKELAKNSNISFDDNVTKEELLELIDTSSNDKIETKLEEVVVAAETKVEEVVEDTETKLEEVVVAAETKVEEVMEETETKLEEAVVAAETKVEEVMEETEAKVEETVVAAETKIDEVVETTTNEIVEQVKKSDNKKIGLIIAIVILVVIGLLSALGGVLYVNFKTYKVLDRPADANVAEFNAVLEDIDSAYSYTQIETDFKIDANLSLEEQKQFYVDTINEGAALDSSFNEIYEYVIECEKDLKITDEELSGLKELYEKLKEGLVSE